jgi:hypothetical protein
MPPRTLDTIMLSALTLVTLLWLEVLPPGLLAQVVMVLLGWALLSTLLVGTAAAWVALARSRHARPASRRQVQHR